MMRLASSRKPVAPGLGDLRQSYSYLPHPAILIILARAQMRCFIVVMGDRLAAGLRTLTP